MKTKNLGAKAKPHSTTRLEQAKRELQAAKAAAKQAKLDLRGARKTARQAKKRFRAAKKELKVFLKEFRKSENKMAERKTHQPKAKKRPQRRTETPVPAALMPRKSRQNIATAKPAHQPNRRLPLENPSQHDDSIEASPAFVPAKAGFGTASQEPGAEPPRTPEV